MSKGILPFNLIKKQVSIKLLPSNITQYKEIKE